MCVSKAIPYVRGLISSQHEAGGKDSAYQITLTNRTIADTMLEIELDATGTGSADYPSIAGIEVICRSLCTCAIDLAPPPIPA